MGKQDLIEQLRSVFPAERIDGSAAFIQWGESYPDADDYARAVDGKTWEEVDAAYAVRRNDALGFLSTRQLVQVLPVYLRSLVNDGVMSPALDSVLVTLTKPMRDPSRKRFDALFSTLTSAQRRVVADVLRQIAEEDPEGSPGRAAQAAFDGGWKEEP